MTTSWFSDFRYAARTLSKRAGFAATVILVLGLGIGGTATLFSVIESVLLRPLPYRAPAELVDLWQNNVSQGVAKDDPFSIPDFFELKEQQKFLSSLAACRFWRWSMSAPNREPEQVMGGQVSAEFFSTLGVQPFLGRDFLREEDKPGGPRALILDHQFWKSRFGGDLAVLGRSVDLDDVAYRIVGVLPASFVSPTGLHEVVWLPLQADPAAAPRQIRWLHGVGRLGKGITLARANRDLRVIMDRLDREHPDVDKGRGAYVLPLREDLVSDIKRSLLILFATVGIVLAIAVINVSGLLLARAVERQREVSLRLALGTSPARLVRLFAAEALVLSLLGGVLGFLLAYLAVRSLPALAPADMPRLSEVSFGPGAGLFTLGLALVCGIASSLLPSLRAATRELQPALREGALTTTGGSRLHAMRRALVVAEIALSGALIISAGLLAKSYYRLQQVDLGFKPARVLTLDLTLPKSRYPAGDPYPKWPTLAELRNRAVGRISALPGVEAVSTVVNHPLNSGFQIPVTFDRRPPPRPGDEDQIYLRPVSAGYLGASGAVLVRGRFFNEPDDLADSAPVVVVNQALVKQYFAGTNPVGERLTFFGRSREIVGVIADEHFLGPAKAVPPAVYPPFLQAPIPWFSLLVRTRSDPRLLIPAIEQAIWSIDPKLAVFNVATLDSLVAKSIGSQRFSMLLLGIFAVIALTLALVGVYGLMAYSVAQRRSEIGVRMAMGADRKRILLLTLGEGTKLLLIGTGLGLLLAYATTRYIASQLFGISATDLGVFLGILCVLFPVGLLACLVPSIRATRVNPVLAMRSQ